MEPMAAHRKVSDGNFAVCCSMLRAIGPSRCSGAGAVLGSFKYVVSSYYCSLFFLAINEEDIGVDALKSYSWSVRDSKSLATYCRFDVDREVPLIQVNRAIPN
jgi:hypothetical protein